ALMFTCLVSCVRRAVAICYVPIFSSMLPRARRCTLFPYTTLFRSSEGDLRALVQKFTEDRQFGIFGEPRVNVLELNLDARLSKKDRKSTRLNSSHVAISYAVFCLKKKKITDISSRKRTQHAQRKQN